jgi:hypothetical protein
MKWIKLALLLSASSAEGAGGAGGNGPAGSEVNGGASEEKDGAGAEEKAKAKKHVPITELHEERRNSAKIKAEYEALLKEKNEREQAELTETERLKKQNETTTAELLSLKGEKAKRDAFRDVKKELPAGYHIPEEAAEDVEAAIDAIVYDSKNPEGVKKEIQRIVNLAKREVAAGGGQKKGNVNSGTAPKTEGADGNSGNKKDTVEDLWNIRQEKGEDSPEYQAMLRKFLK